MHSHTIIDTASPRYGFDPRIAFATTLAGAAPPLQGRGGGPYRAQAARRTRRAQDVAQRQAPLACRHAHATYARLWRAIAAAPAAKRRDAWPSRASTTATTADSP